MVTIKIADHLRWFREMLGFEIDAFLRRRGWKHTSEGNPGSFLLWVKEIDGVEMRVSRDMAIRFEEHIEVHDCTCSPFHTDEDCPVHGGWDHA